MKTSPSMIKSKSRMSAARGQRKYTWIDDITDYLADPTKPIKIKHYVVRRFRNHIPLVDTTTRTMLVTNQFWS